MRHKTVEELWEDFKSRVVLMHLDKSILDASDSAAREILETIRSAFFCGFAGLMQFLGESQSAVEAGAMTAKETQKHVGLYYKELNKFLIGKLSECDRSISEHN